MGRTARSILNHTHPASRGVKLCTELESARLSSTEATSSPLVVDVGVADVMVAASVVGDSRRAREKRGGGCADAAEGPSSGNYK